MFHKWKLTPLKYIQKEFGNNSSILTYKSYYIYFALFQGL